MADTGQDDAAKQRALSFAKFLAEMSPERRARANEHIRQVATEEHKRFSEAFKAGQCCFCGDALTSFDQATPCRHWLLKPEGFGKEHFWLLARMATPRRARRPRRPFAKSWRRE